MDSENNFVAIEKFMCNICGVTHSHGGGVLINMKLKKIPEDPIVGYSRCKEDDDKFKNDYVALVVINNDNIDGDEDERIKLWDANRTGEIIHIKYDVFNKIFNRDIPSTLDMAFIDVDTANAIKNIPISDD